MRNSRLDKHGRCELEVEGGYGQAFVRRGLKM